MGPFRLAPRLPWPIASILVVSALPGVAHADRLGDFTMGPGDSMLVAAIIALPVALACALVAWFGYARRWPVWLGVLAFAAMVFAQTSEAGYHAMLAFDAAFFAHQLYQNNIVFVACIVFSIPVAPVYGSVACAAFVRDPSNRAIAAWGLAWIDVAVLAATMPGTNDVPMVYPLCTGAMISLAGWTLAHALRARRETARVAS